MKNTVWVYLLVVIALIVVFAVGNSVGQRTMLSALTTQLNGVQAMLTFNHLLEDREMQSLLARGCVQQAALRIDIANDKDMESLSGFFRRKLDPSARAYVLQRDPGLIDDMKTFTSKYGSSWSVPECKN